MRGRRPAKTVLAKSRVRSGMFGNFTTIEVGDLPQTSRLIWESLPPQEKALADEREVNSREFMPLDWRHFQTEPRSFRSRFAYAPVGTMRVSRVADTQPTQFTRRSPGIDTYCVSLMARGTSQVVQPGSREPAVGNTETGLIFAARGLPSTAAASVSIFGCLATPLNITDEPIHRSPSAVAQVDSS